MNAKLLWKELQKGNKTAFNQLFELYYNDLKAYGMKISQNEDFANEAIQLLFIKIWEKRYTLNTVTSVKSYILSAYRRTLIDLIVREKKQHQLSNKNETFQITAAELSLFQQEQKEKAHQLANLLNQLPVKQKEIIYLRFYNQLSYLEIAEIIDLNYQSVRNYGVKAIQFLRINWKK